MNTENIRNLATKTLDQSNMRSSAEACIADSKRLDLNGDAEAARMWALKALTYTIGVFDPRYQEVAMGNDAVRAH